MALLFTLEQCLDVLVPCFLDHSEHSTHILFHVVSLCLRLLDMTLDRVEKLCHLWVCPFIVHVTGRHQAFAVPYLVLPGFIFIWFVATKFVLARLTRKRMVMTVLFGEMLMLSNDSLRSLSLLLVWLIKIIEESFLLHSLSSCLLILLLQLLLLSEVRTSNRVLVSEYRFLESGLLLTFIGSQSLGLSKIIVF